jgi:hypothetical protein
MRPRSLILMLTAVLITPAMASASPKKPPAKHKASAKPVTPCFPGQPSVAARDIHTKLKRYADSLFAQPEDPPLPPAKFGTCTIKGNVLREANGKVVAELGCGIRVLSRGIHDELGIEIGARGQDVIDHKPASAKVLRCVANGPDQVRCRFDRAPDEDIDANDYSVAGKLGEDVLVGDAAVAFFAPRTVLELEANVWCH